MKINIAEYFLTYILTGWNLQGPYHVNNLGYVNSQDLKFLLSAISIYQYLHIANMA